MLFETYKLLLNSIFIKIQVNNYFIGYATLLYGVESNCYLKHMNWLPSICKYKIDVTPPLPLLKVSYFILI